MRERIAIIAGGGRLPRMAAHHLLQQGENPFIVAFATTQAADIMEGIDAYDHICIGWGEVQRFINTLKKRGCKKLCFVGHVVRPDIKSIKFDLGGLFALPRILKAGLGGDDKILRHICTLLEEKGFEVLGVHELVPDLIFPHDYHAGPRPYKGFKKDLEIGKNAIRTLSCLDIGQSFVIIREQIVAVEGAEGTDGLLERVADMRQKGRVRVKPSRGLFIKASKEGQDLRFDMPVFGLKTLEGVHNAGLGAVALEEKRLLCPDLDVLDKQARDLSVCVSSFTL